MVPDVLIVGGGVIGCAIAYNLAKAGVRLLLIEKEGIASQASGASAGMLDPMAEIGPGPLLELGLKSLELFPSLTERLREDSGIDAGYYPAGLLSIARSEAEEEELKGRLNWQRERGLKAGWLTDKEVRGMEPALTPEVRGGIYYPDMAYVNPYRLTQALAQSAVRSGAELRLGCKATGIITSGSRVLGVRLLNEEVRAGHVIIATGAYTGVWGEWLGPKLPIFPVKGQLMALHKMPLILNHVVYAGHLGYLVPRRDGTIIVGATQEDAGFDMKVTSGGLAHLSTLAERLVPGLKGAPFLRAWAGLRPGTPDGLPILGPLADWRGLTIASGHFRKGILLAPITGQIITSLLMEEAPALPLKPFLPDRFSQV